MSGTVWGWLDGMPLQADWMLDRGLHYGDGLFETMVLQRGHLRFAALHAARLADGCRRLGIACDATAALAAAEPLLGGGEAMAKLIVTRGVATERGYAPSGTEKARVLLLRYAAPAAQPQGIVDTEVTLLNARLGENPLLAGLKHLNRLELVLARAQLQGSGCFEGILCSSSGYLACGTMSNLFIVKDDHLLTPRVDRCGIAGVMRAVVMREARALGIAIHECDLPPETLLQAQHAFLTNVRLGVRPITRLGSRVLEAGQLSLRLHERVAGLED
jgi:4-amino-4-deoxychorismate lyase